MERRPSRLDEPWYGTRPCLFAAWLALAPLAGLAYWYVALRVRR